jgi:hypothetical protein
MRLEGKEPNRFNGLPGVRKRLKQLSLDARHEHPTEVGCY